MEAERRKERRKEEDDDKGPLSVQLAGLNSYCWNFKNSRKACEQKLI